MSARSDFVSIEVAGERIDVWTEYRVASDLLTPSDAFTLTLQLGGRGQTRSDEFARIRDLCAPLASVKLFIGADIHGGARTRALQLTGFIDDREIDVSRSRGSVISITGRDNAGHLCDSAVPVSLVRTQTAGGTFIDLARAAVAPWGIEVVSDSSAARTLLTGEAGLTPEQRLRVEQARVQGIPADAMTRHILREAQAAQVPIDEFTGTTPSARARSHSSTEAGVGSDIERLRVAEASPRAGETAWSFLARHAERLHILMWFSPDGKLILGSPDYGQRSRYRFLRRFTSDAAEPNNFSEGNWKASGADRYSKVTVYGRVHGHDVTRSRIRSVVKDDSMPFERHKIEHLGDCTTREQADSAAKRLMREGIASSHVLQLVADDHGQGRYLYAVDTMADVVDEYEDFFGQMYCIGRTFERSRANGTRTQMRFIEPGTLVL